MNNMPITDLIVYTKGGEFNYSGKDAHKVYSSINNTGSKGYAWTTPIELENGRSCVFVIGSIEMMEFK